MFRFGIFPQKKINYINRKAIEYDRQQNDCYNPILSPFVQKELNKQVAEDVFNESLRNTLSVITVKLTYIVMMYGILSIALIVND
jgi:hypothetical protein